MKEAATILQLTVAILATIRALVLGKSSRWGFRASNDNKPRASREPWLLALVLWIDVLNEWTNRLVNAHLPPPGGPPLEGIARAGAHVGLALYAAWLCGALAFVGWLGRGRIGAVGLGAAVALWLVFVGAAVFGYPEIRGETVLRLLGALHIAVFAFQAPCFFTFPVTRKERLRTERVCALWLTFLGLAAGIGPLRPWAKETINRIAAESTMAAAMLVLYSSIVVTIVVGGSPWIKLWLRGQRS